MRIIFSLPMFFVLNCGCKYLGVTNLFAAVGISVGVSLLADLGVRLSNEA